MKAISNQVYKDLARILPILARVADSSIDTKIANAGRLARKYARKFNQETKTK